MEKEAIFILVAMVLVGYPLCYLALLIGTRVTDQWHVSRKRIAIATIGLWVITSVIDYGIVSVWDSSPMEWPVFLIFAAIWGGALLAVTAVYVFIAKRRFARERGGLTFLGTFSGTILLFVLKVVAGGLLVVISQTIGSIQYKAAMAQYNEEKIEVTQTDLAADGIPLPAGVTEMIGDGANSSFAIIEQRPDRNAVNPDDWHVNYPPETLHMLHSQSDPLEIETALVEDLRRAGFTVYYHANLPGCGMQSTAGPYIAGCKDGIFVQYKIDQMPSGSPSGMTTVWMKIWRRYSAEIHGLALARMQPHI